MITSEKIHLIDDDSEICCSLELLLQLEGYTIDIYNSVRSFLDIVNQNQTGCIITDVRMEAYPVVPGLPISSGYTISAG